MISVDEARERILGHARVLEPVRVPILDALNMVLAEDLIAGFDIPPLTNAAMDGYAVLATDTARASTAAPVRLRVIEELPAGRPARHAVEAGTAIRIMTGAPLPGGADTVVQFENTTEGQGVTPNGWVDVLVPAGPGINIRQAGEDVRQGHEIVRRGATLRPADIGVIASLGRADVLVHRRPRVAILSTGDEVIEPGRALEPGQIYDANGYALAAQVKSAGGEPVMLGIARDEMGDLVARIRRGLETDLIVTSAGVSTGDYDIVKDALVAQGEISFWLVRMRPGKPLAFGQIGGIPHIGLPGNPVSSMISFELFARPAILKMLGKTDFDRPTIEAVASDVIINRENRRSFFRARIDRSDDGYVASLTGPQGSGILTSMMQANCLLVVPEHVSRVNPGDRVRVVLIDQPETSSV
ncbi:MAG TPA: gephyrin-like molybdotransferase Glp [Chloroflexota bacterium]|nr:gephyrin-like molybdotransferase Glp [Chloroflexota bacterium]